MRQSILVVALAGALVACSGDPTPPAGPPPPGCQLPAGFFASECYSSAIATEQSCTTTDGGTWLPGGCSRGSDLVGICIDAGRTTYTYSSAFAFYATNDAAADCSLVNGTFVPMGARKSESCDFRPDIFAMCADGTGTVSDVTQGERECGWNGGTLFAGPCPTAGRSGTCSYTNSYGIDVKERWYQGTTATQAGCTNPGDVWTAG